MNSLRSKVVSGFGWRGFAELSSILLQIAFTAVLARLLSLTDFGLAAMCLLFIRFVRALTDVGFGSAVIQSQQITSRQVSAIFCIQLGIKVAIFGLCLAGAPLAALFFEQASLTDLIRVLALVVIIDGLSFPGTIAQKNLRFKGISLLQLFGLIVGNATGIVLALTGFGVWSLIVRILVERSIVAILIWPIVGWWPVRPEFRGIGKFLRFGATMFVSTAVYFVSQNLAAIIIGKFIGVEILGLYNVAYNLGIVPAQKIQSVLTSVLMPAFATRQRAKDRLRDAVYKSWFSVGVVFIPMMLGLAAVAPVFVPLVYGGKWAMAGQFLTILAVVGLLKGFEHLLRTVLVAVGQPRKILEITLIETALSIPLLWLGTQYIGVWGIIGAYLLSAIIAFMFTAHFAQRALEAPGMVAGTTTRSLLIGGTMFTIVFLLPSILGRSDALILSLQIAAGVAIYATFRWFTFSPEERQIVSEWPVIGKHIPTR